MMLKKALGAFTGRISVVCWSGGRGARALEELFRGTKAAMGLYNSVNIYLFYV